MSAWYLQRYSLAAVTGNLPGQFRAVELDQAGNDAFIYDNGTDVEYREAVACPCAQVESLRSRRWCYACNGLKYIHPPRLRKQLRILLVGRTNRSQPDAAGGLIRGRVQQATFPTCYDPHEGDLILPCGQTHTVHEYVTRANTPVTAAAVRDLQKSDFEVVPEITAADDRLRYPTISRIIGVFGYDPEKFDAIVAETGQDPENLDRATLDRLSWEATREYTEADYTLVGNVIRWNEGGNCPREGEVYSVKYEAPAVYCVAEEPVDRFDGNQKLPARVSAIRLDAYGQNTLGRA